MGRGPLRKVRGTGHPAAGVNGAQTGTSRSSALAGILSQNGGRHSRRREALQPSTRRAAVTALPRLATRSSGFVPKPLRPWTVRPIVSGEGARMGLEPMNFHEPDGAAPAALKDRMLAYERKLIQDALRASGGHQRRAAVLLGVLPTTLHEKMRRLGICTRNQRVALLGSAGGGPGRGQSPPEPHGRDGAA